MKVGGSYILSSINVIDIRIYFYCQQQIREAIVCIAIEEVEFLNY
jgi:hypothetical protein